MHDISTHGWCAQEHAPLSLVAEKEVQFFIDNLEVTRDELDPGVAHIHTPIHAPIIHAPINPS